MSIRNREDLRAQEMDRQLAGLQVVGVPAELLGEAQMAVAALCEELDSTDEDVVEVEMGQGDWIRGHSVLSVVTLIRLGWRPPA
jgi:hypothetical protein